MIPARIRISWLLLLCACLYPEVGGAQSFSRPCRRFTIRDGLAQQQVRAFWEDSRGYIWIGTEGGFSRFDGYTLKPFTRSTGFSGRKVYSFREAPDGNIWYRSADTVYRFDGRTEQALPMTPEFWQSQPPHLWPLITLQIPSLLGQRYPELKNLSVGYAMITDTAGAAIIVDWSKRICYRILDQCVSSPLPPDFPAYGQEDGHCQYIEARQQYYAWAATGWQLLVGQNEHGVPQKMHALAPEVLNVNRNGIPSFWILEDNKYHSVEPGLFNRVDKTWMDSRRRMLVATDEGLGLMYPDGPEFLQLPQARHPWAILPDHQGNNWISSLHDGLFCLSDQLPARHYPLPKEPDTHQLFPGKLPGPDGALLFGGYKGVYQWRNGRLQFFHLGEPIEALCYDAARQCYWVAGSRIYALNIGLEKLSQTISLPPELAKADLGLTDLDMAPDGHLWATGYNGTACLTPDGRILFFETESGPGNCLQFDHTGTLWLGTQKGLFKFDEKAGRFTKVADFLFNNPVNNLLPLPGPQMVVITDTEVYLLKTDQPIQPELVAYWSYQNGYQLLEAVNNGAGYDGKYLWVPAGNGIQRINLGPYLAPQKNDIPGLRIDRIQQEWFALTQTEPEISVNGSTAEVWLSLINLNADHFTLEYAVNNGPWTALEHPLQGTVAGLQHGANQLTFRARIPLMSEDKWPSVACSLYAELPVWQRPWILWSLIGLILIFLFVFWHNRKNQRKLHDLLHQAQLGTVQAQLNPHILFNLLTSLQNSITNKNKQAASDHLVRISRLIRDVLELSLKLDQSPRYNFPTITLKEELQFLENYLHLEAEQHAPAFSYEIRNEASDQLLLPPLLVQPLVENAILHGIMPNTGKSGRILVHFREDAGQLVITVTDNGVGLGNNRPSQGSRYRSRGGELLQKRLQLLQQLGYPTKYSVQSGPKGGVVAEIRIKIMT